MTPIYWCPKRENSTALRLGSIQTVKGQKLKLDLYLSMLGRRVQEMIEAAENPRLALADLKERMREAGLNPGPADLDEAGSALIPSNPLMGDYLQTKGLNLDLPPTVKAETPGAREAYQEVTIEEWTALIGGDSTLA